MVDEPLRTRAARDAAEAALVRIVHHYGGRPEFVVFGGLVPELLCSGSPHRHAGTTDIDVQVNLEIACGSVHTKRLEQALIKAQFVPTNERIWQWVTDNPSTVKTVVKFEMLADLESVVAGETLKFDGCDQLGAVNLRGTRFAIRDIVERELQSSIGDVPYAVKISVTGLAGFLLAKTAAAYSRSKPKDWYDVAFVLLHNDAGGPKAAALEVRRIFGKELVGAIRTALDELFANFQSTNNQGPQAYVTQMLIDHPDRNRKELLADAVLAIGEFYSELFGLPNDQD